MVTRSRIFAALAVAFAFVALAPAAAHADTIGDLISQAKRGDEKIRLSAVLGLQKQTDQRVVQPLIDALKDSDRNVRAAAAIGLGKVVTAATKPAMQKAAIAALEAAAKADKSDIVRTRAKDASKVIAALSSGGSTSSAGGALPAGSVYVDIGPMTATDPKLKAAMRSTTQSQLGKSAKSWATAWPGGKTPTQAQLKGITAFHVDGTVVDVKVSGDVVSCKISMLIATYPDKSMFGFLKGGASVQGGTTDRDKADCVSAVVEDMVMKKIVPAIQAKVP
jgi:hypothetical protein